MKETTNHAKGIIARPTTIYPRDFMAVHTSSVFHGAQSSFAPTQMI
jgi:hypothetical protein